MCVNGQIWLFLRREKGKKRGQDMIWADKTLFYGQRDDIEHTEKQPWVVEVGVCAAQYDGIYEADKSEVCGDPVP